MIYTVLIVDDSKLARMAVAKVLNTLHPDWKRVEAANATEALERTKELSPEVVLLDFNMPGKDGVTLAAELRALDPRMGVAVISANRQVGVVNRTRAAGATFLPKPLTESALADFLTSVLQQRREVSK
ncbi:MAG: response regulator transcription factor [Steroidobacteraceae bacterium]